MTGPVDKNTPTGAAGKAEDIDDQPKARVIAQPALDTKSLTVRQSSAILGALNPDSPIADDAKDRILAATVSESTITLTPSKTVAATDAVTLDFTTSNATQAIHMTLNEPDQNVTQIVIGNNGAFSLSVIKHLIAAYPNLQTIQMDLAPYILPALQSDIQTSPEDRAAAERERIAEIEEQHASFVRPTSIAPESAVTLDLRGNKTITNPRLRDLIEKKPHLKNILLEGSSINPVIKYRIKARIDFNTALEFFNSDRLPLKLSTVFNAGMTSDFKIPFQSQTAMEIDTLLDTIEQNPEQAAFITDLSFAENINFNDRHLKRLATLSDQLKHLTRLDITDTGVKELPDIPIAFTNLKIVYETAPP